MIDLNPHVAPNVQKRIGSLVMSDLAMDELGKVLAESGNGDFATPENVGPIVAATVAGFLDSAYFEKSKWFRVQPVHRTVTMTIQSDPPVTPIMHLQKTVQGHQLVTLDECPIAENYCEERVIEETKVEIGMCS